jgi:hypothetical protein
MDWVLRFRTEAFDYKGPIREDANAGNKFYGEDMALALETYVKPHTTHIVCIDEDWGWYLDFAQTDGRITEVGVYNEAVADGPAEGNGTNEWALRFQQYVPGKRFGFIPKKEKVDPSPELRGLLEGFVRQHGGTVLEWGRE